LALWQTTAGNRCPFSIKKTQFGAGFFLAFLGQSSILFFPLCAQTVDELAPYFVTIVRLASPGLNRQYAVVAANPKRLH
jgi:hypothetical protein